MGSSTSRTYFRFRLDEAGVTPPTHIYIVGTTPAWAGQIVHDECKDAYPKATVASSDSSAHNAGLILFPYTRNAFREHPAKWAGIALSRGRTPVILFGVTHRSIYITTGMGLIRYAAADMVLELLAFMKGMLRRATGKQRTGAA